MSYPSLTLTRFMILPRIHEISELGRSTFIDHHKLSTFKLFTIMLP